MPIATQEQVDTLKKILKRADLLPADPEIVTVENHGKSGGWIYIDMEGRETLIQLTKEVLRQNQYPIQDITDNILAVMPPPTFIAREVASDALAKHVRTCRLCTDEGPQYGCDLGQEMFEQSKR